MGDHLRLQSAARTLLIRRGIDPAVWEARGCQRYEQGDAWVRDRFRGLVTSRKLGFVTKTVNQSPGWLMPRYPPEGLNPITPQLRPDEPIIMHARTVLHYHGPTGGQWPTHAGRRLKRNRVLTGYAAYKHVNSKTGDPEEPSYDPATGIGRHKGVPIDVVHKHAPKTSKYVNIGHASRIDLHPWAAELLPAASIVFFVLEGTPKTDAVLSAGGVSFGVPSVTCWPTRELKWFADEMLRDKTVLVVPDADW